MSVGETRYAIASEIDSRHRGWIIDHLLTQPWAHGRSRGFVAYAMRRSMVLCAYEGRDFAGFARILTDHSSYALATELMMLPGHGVECERAIVADLETHPKLQIGRRFVHPSWIGEIPRGYVRLRRSSEDGHSLPWGGGRDPHESVSRVRA